VRGSVDCFRLFFKSDLAVQFSYFRLKEEGSDDERSHSPSPSRNIVIRSTLNENLSIFLTEMEFAALVDTVHDINRKYIETGLVPVHRYLVTTQVDYSTGTTIWSVDTFVDITADGTVVIYKYEFQAFNNLLTDVVPCGQSERVTEMVEMTVGDFVELPEISRKFILHRECYMDIE
jgi:hypothetical protein